MKKLMIVLSLIISAQVYSEGPLKKEILDNFSDKIKEINIVNGDAEITFIKHAAFYKLKKENPKFKEILAILELKKKDQKKLQITASIPKMEIQEVKE